MWDFESANTKKFFGSNLEKAKTNHDKELKKVKDKFIETYPYAKLSEFEFWINLSKTGDIASKTNVVYKGDGTKLYDLTGRTWKHSWDVTSDVFKYKYSGALHWGPSKIWDPTTVTKSFGVGNGVLPFRPNHFRIFINEDQSFVFESTTLNTKWSNSKNVKDIRTVSLDKDDPYFASLMASFIISQKSGICTKHLMGSEGSAGVPKIVTSVLRFYVHYHMSRFLRSPDKMEKHITEEMTNLIRKNLPVKKLWTKKYHQGKETIGASLRTQPNKLNIRNARHYGSGFGGVIGIEYEEVTEVLPADEANDWKKFFLTDSEGITKTGQLFLQKAVEAYVYCVLGAQAKTRWKIVGDGAKSLQTQEAFAKLVKETVAQDDDSVLISNMRTAVKATNVVLILAILPGMILIPSDLIILKEKISGYNNTLTMATKSMSFGKNEKINFSEDPKDPKAPKAPKEVEATEDEQKTAKTRLGNVNNAVGKNNELIAVFVSLTIVGALGFHLLAS